MSPDLHFSAGGRHTRCRIGGQQTPMRIARLLLLPCHEDYISHKFIRSCGMRSRIVSLQYQEGTPPSLSYAVPKSTLILKGPYRRLIITR